MLRIARRRLPRLAALFGPVRLARSPDRGHAGRGDGAHRPDHEPAGGLRRDPRARARVVVRPDLQRPGAGALARRGVRLLRRGGRGRPAAALVPPAGPRGAPRHARHGVLPAPSLQRLRRDLLRGRVPARRAAQAHGPAPCSTPRCATTRSRTATAGRPPPSSAPRWTPRRRCRSTTSGAATGSPERRLTCAATSVRPAAVATQISRPEDDEAGAAEAAERRRRHRSSRRERERHEPVARRRRSSSPPTAGRRPRRSRRR